MMTMMLLFCGGVSKDKAEYVYSSMRTLDTQQYACDAACIRTVLQIKLKGKGFRISFLTLRPVSCVVKKLDRG